HFLNGYHSPSSSTKRTVQTVVIDRRTCELHYPISVITRLKQDVLACTDRIRWPESKSHQPQILASTRERDIHKLRSVLDQKVPSIQSPTQTTQPQHVDTVPALDEAPTGPNTDAYSSLIPCGFSVLGITSKGVPEAMRMKKQGFSDKSQNQQRTPGLIHHLKDTWSRNLMREAIENNDFLRHLSKAQIEGIVCCMYRRNILQGFYIIRGGQSGGALYVVAEGVLDVSNQSQLLGRMDVGRAFDELALLYNCNQTASVRAITKASAWTLDRSVFQQIMMSSGLHQTEENIELLNSFPALESLSPEKMRILEDALETIYYGPDEYVIHEGEIVNVLYRSTRNCTSIYIDRWHG
ncbi:cGMP-dependent protein kinase egl-4, partial [Fasciola hepatica]